MIITIYIIIVHRIDVQKWDDEINQGTIIIDFDENKDKIYNIYYSSVYTLMKNVVQVVVYTIMSIYFSVSSIAITFYIFTISITSTVYN